MKIKVVVSDMDGTLLNSNHEISDYSKKIVKKIIDKGIKFFIATGRHYQDLKIYANELSENIYTITSNGAVIHSGEGELLYSNSLCELLVSEVSDLVSFESEIMINYYDNEKWLSFERNDYIEQYSNKSGFKPEIIKRDELKNYNIVKIYFMSHNAEKLNELKFKLEQKFSEKISVFFSAEHFLEVVAKGISKAEALKVVLERENLKLEETIAFGDGMNDFEMLNEVGKGIVMGNAAVVLKDKLSGNEVIGTCDEDSVAKYLEKYL